MNSTNFTTNALQAGYFAANEETYLFGLSNVAKKSADEMKLFSAKSKVHQSSFYLVCSQQRQLPDQQQLVKEKHKELIRMPETKWNIQDWK